MDTTVEPRSKVCTPDEAVAGIADGSTLTIGGNHAHNNPIALVHALVRKGARNLTLIPTPSAGIAIDMLIGAGCVERVHVPYIGLEFLGMAPNFRRAAEAKTIEVVEGDEAWIVFGLRAGAGRLPFMPIAPMYEGTDLPKVNSLVRTTTDPYTGDTVATVPALRADYLLCHAQVSDSRGNAQLRGQVEFEWLMAKASDHTIVSADRILDASAPRPDPRHVSVPGVLVRHVAHAPYGAHPTSSAGQYDYDRPMLVEYRDLAGDDRSDEYFDRYVFGVKDHFGYLDAVGSGRLAGLQQTMD